MLRVLGYLLGGLGVLIVLVAVASLVATRTWNQRVQREAAALLAGAAAKPGGRVITAADLRGLPEPVQNWLQRSGAVGKPRVSTVRLRQKGVIRTKETQPWMPFTAVQYYTVDKPGFLWSVRVKAAPLVQLVGRDRYVDGSGHMLIRLLALKTVAEGRGAEVNQGDLLRFLSEIMWFPSAALSDYIKWEPVAANSAKATMSYKGVTASGVFTFNRDGDPVGFRAERYAALDGGYALQPWSGVVSAYKEFGGVRIPSSVEVMWHFKTGQFTYFKGEITTVEYNVPAVY